MIKHNEEQKQKRVVLIDAAMSSSEDAIKETVELIKACDWDCVDVWVQRIKSITNATYLGKGKVEEFHEQLQKEKIEQVIFQQTLSPMQAANLEDLLEVPVIDRSELIVEIFEQRAHTQEAKLQVQSAKLRKQRSRLIGRDTSLGRQGGGKNKGQGEKQLELDRRIIKQRMEDCDRQLEELKKHRAIQHTQRKKRSFFQVALIGYTNAGKSTLLNALLDHNDRHEDSHVLAKDQLFATLDTALRRISLPNAPDVILADTVGFVSDLPHELVHAFHATLEEVRQSDLLIHVVNIANEEHRTQMETTQNTLRELHADHIPMITVYNQCDLTKIPYPELHEATIYMSAKLQIGIDVLLETVATHLFGPYEDIALLVPYEESSVIPAILRDLLVEKQENRENGTYFKGKIRKKLKAAYLNYVKF